MAVSVTEHVQKAEGVPVMAPVDELMDRPVGRPVWVQVKVVNAAEESVAVGVSVEIAVPLLDLWLAIVVIATVLVMVQVKLTEFEYVVGEPLSVAVTVTAQAHAVVGVPLMTPVAEAIDRPAGRPVAVQARVAVDEESVAVAVMEAMAVPDTLDLAVVVGLVTATVLVMVQVNADVDTALEAMSVAVRVTEQAHAVVGVPVMAPVEELMARPAGRPDWVHVSAFELWVE